MGAGAARGARKPGGGNIPDAAALAERIIKEFLDPNYDGLDFRSAYDLAASSRSVRDLQTFLHTELIDYQPADFHLIIPSFVWAGLVTMPLLFIARCGGGMRSTATCVNLK
jgi:hypothetical protein